MGETEPGVRRSRLVGRMRLWVANGEDIGILDGNPHTFPGIFLVLWSGLRMSYSCSLSDLSLCSPASAVWLEGYLAGAEPGAWFGPEFDYDESDARTGQWRDALRLFHETGTWKVGRICEADGLEMLPSEPPGRLCKTHRSDSTVTQWPTIYGRVSPPDRLRDRLESLRDLALV